MRKCYFSSFKHYLEKLFLGKLMTEFSREVCSRFITLYNLNINLYKIGQTWDAMGNMFFS